MTDKQKILVCGDVNGKFNSLFSRAESLNKKSGPFDFLLICGNFFGANNAEFQAYRNGGRTVAVPTFILGPCNKSVESLYPQNEGDEICPNVTYLGKRGVYTTSSGLKIAYLSGIQNEQQNAVTFSGNDCCAVRDACYRGQPDFKGVDILITSDWPANVRNLDEKQIDINIEGSMCVSWLAMHIKPRYHFVASPSYYYERAPYRNFNKKHNTRDLATRFIAVAPNGNDRKEKWLYACSLQPMNKIRMMDLLQGTTDETPCPYDDNLLNQNAPGSTQKSMGNDQYFYDMQSSNDGNQGYKRKRKNDGPDNERKRPEFDQEKCWFCLSSPTVEKHLVICVGDSCYLALAKGPLTPMHCLILPVAHYQSTTQSPDEVKMEIRKFKEALIKFFKSIGDVAVFFERNFKTSHLQIQCVPIPFNLARNVAEEFEEQGSSERIEFEKLSPDDDLSDVVAPGVPYFHVDLPDGNQFFTKTKPNFPLQFGRDILASSALLDCEDKADWRSCQLSKEDESKYVAAFRKKFTPFNFTLED